MRPPADLHPYRATLDDGKDDPAQADPRYRLATDLLTRGVRYERAAQILRELARDFPGSYRTRLALACALVGRVASLAYAGAFADALERDRATYPKRFREWETKVRKPGEDAESDRPVPPPAGAVLIKDDQTPYRLTRDELKKRAVALRAEAETHLEAATRHTEGRAATGEAAYHFGWCLRVLANYANLPDVTILMWAGEDDGGITLFPAPEGKEMARRFRAVARRRPDRRRAGGGAPPFPRAGPAPADALASPGGRDAGTVSAGPGRYHGRGGRGGFRRGGRNATAQATVAPNGAG
jgi:hypothetical protein